MHLSAPVENLLRRLHAKRSGAGWTAKCPAHDDQKPSLSIDEGSDGRALILCRAGCATDDVLAALGLTPRDLFPVATYPQPSGNGATPTLDWQKCVDAFTDKHVEQLAEWRGYLPAFVQDLRDTRQIGIYKGLVAFPVHDNDDVVGTHFRLKSGDWNYAPKGIKAAPLVFGELTPGERVQAFESTWDGLDYMDKSGERDGVIITRGASNGGLVVDLIPPNSTCFCWTQNDQAGEKWQGDICAHSKATVKRVRIPAPFKDLNAWTKSESGATTRDLIDAMANAEVVREAEKSWDDALAESELTATELHDLKLMPRRKLLGDWFCEGDCGFIFAFRGTGKTWLALAIAQALAAGGKLGDWQAHEPVKVLYLDSEMPPDLMRERCDGLGNGK